MTDRLGIFCVSALERIRLDTSAYIDGVTTTDLKAGLISYYAHASYIF